MCDVRGAISKGDGGKVVGLVISLAHDADPTIFLLTPLLIIKFSVIVRSDAHK